MAADAAVLGTTNVVNTSFGDWGQKLMLVAGIAAVVAVMVVFWMWSQKPDYRILYANYADKDGGAIVAALEKMNVPYQFSDSGAAILVPAEHVHEARLKLAAQGLPKGGNIGFELLENQKFGVSQFVEQVNFQRALEGELERSIQSISAVQAARIHLAIPKPSVFVRDQQAPTASVLLNLHPGRTLDAQQVGAVVHLVASSVPNLPVRNVTVVDQNGNLISDTSKKSQHNGLDSEQIKYIEDMQRSIARRVESIITPIVGPKNVRAEVSAEIDFSSVEKAAESYKPNTQPDSMVIRSAKMHESKNGGEGAEAGGVPGALSNQPPENNTAPIVAPEGTDGTTSGANGAGTNVAIQKDSTTNYEVDKTVSYTQQPKGGIKQLHVAVVVNHVPAVDKKTGKTSYRPLNEAEKQQVNDLAMQAMGFNKERGDSISVVNSPFVGESLEPVPELPLWKNPMLITHGKDALRFIVGILVFMMVYKKMLKPMMTYLLKPKTPVAGSAGALGNGSQGDNEDALVTISNSRPALSAELTQSIDTVKQIAKENPRMVANVVSNWTSGQK